MAEAARRGDAGLAVAALTDLIQQLRLQRLKRTVLSLTVVRRIARDLHDRIPEQIQQRDVAALLRHARRRARTRLRHRSRAVPSARSSS